MKSETSSCCFAGMSRSGFIKGMVASLGALGSGCINAGAAKRPVRFGVVTDTHYSRRARWADRHYRDSLAKMRQAVGVFNDAGLDFVIELGDMKDMGELNAKRNGVAVPRPPEELRAEAIGFLDEIEAEFARFNGPRYHALGNHDMDCISKEDFLGHTVNHGAAKGMAHYSFMAGDVKFVVLDACFNKDRTPYCRGNFDWTQAFIPDGELDWFDAELAASTTPVVVFCHQLLDGFSKRKGLSGLFVANWKRAVEIIERRGNVIASIQGHHHSGHYSFRKGIHYWTMKGMITGANPPHNSYAVVEISPDGRLVVMGFADCESRVLAKAVC